MGTCVTLVTFVTMVAGVVDSIGFIGSVGSIRLVGICESGNDGMVVTFTTSGLLVSLLSLEREDDGGSGMEEEVLVTFATEDDEGSEVEVMGLEEALVSLVTGVP